MKQFLFLNNDSKEGSSFIITMDKDKVFISTEFGEWECLDSEILLNEIICDYISDKITLIGVV